MKSRTFKRKKMLFLQRNDKYCLLQMLIKWSDRITQTFYNQYGCKNQQIKGFRHVCFLALCCSVFREKFSGVLKMCIWFSLNCVWRLLYAGKLLQ